MHKITREDSMKKYIASKIYYSNQTIMTLGVNKSFNVVAFIQNRVSN